MPNILRSQLQDTIHIPRPADTIPATAPIQETAGRVKDSSARQEQGDSTVPTPASVLVKKPGPLKVTSQEQPDTVQERPVFEEKWNTSSDFFTENGLKGIVNGISRKTGISTEYSGSLQPPHMIPVHRKPYTYDWLLGIFLFLVLLFVWIRIFYSKFFINLANALVSFQLSVKLFHEKNVLQQRVSTVLNFIYIIVTAIFIFEIIEYYGFSKTGMTGINLFLLLLNILMIYTILRVIMLKITGSLFMASPLISEYIHNTFVVNKGLGILLFPVVIMAHYLPYRIVPVMIVLGVLFIAIAFLLKSFRAYQIIIRRDVLLFYLILYLCTLEILPVLLGYKFVISLIQSN